MSTLRVFELAREYKTPVRQFLQVIRQGGVDVNGHFDELTEEQAALVKKIMKAPGGGVASSKGAATGVRRRVISARKEEDEVEPEEEAEEETNKVITIKARTRTDDGENRPRRIRRATKSEASAPAEQKPDEAAVAEVLGTLSVRVAETLMRSTGSARA